LPNVDLLLSSIDNLNIAKVSKDNLKSLIKNWPTAEFDDLVRTAAEEK